MFVFFGKHCVVKSEIIEGEIFAQIIKNILPAYVQIAILGDSIFNQLETDGLLQIRIAFLHAFSRIEFRITLNHIAFQETVRKRQLHTGHQRIHGGAPVLHPLLRVITAFDLCLEAAAHRGLVLHLPVREGA